MKINKKEIIFISLLFIFSLFFRWNLVRDNHFLFYYDQARDAHFSRNIIEKRDLKIQGPSASGTNDTVYHGVLYYYIIGPAYTLSNGNPAVVVFLLTLINSLTLIPIYLLTKSLFKNKTAGYLACFLYAFSADAGEIGSWLSNPALATLTIAWFYYFLWKVFFAGEKRYLGWLGLMLGLTNQSAIWSIYLVITVLICYGIQAKKEKRWFLFNLKQFSSGLLIYFLTISSMLMTQFKLYKSGIFSLQILSQHTQNYIKESAQIVERLKQYVEKISYALTPSWPTVSIVCFILALIWFINSKFKKNLKIFLMIWFLSPLCLFFKNSYYVLIGILPVLYIVVSVCLWRLGKYKLGRYLVIIFLLLFAFSNMMAVDKVRKQEFNHVSNIQKGAYLHQQLALIDKTYEIAGNKEFSISSLTNPYKYNTTWAYLYNWYGKEKYGYIPYWFGSSQKGMPADILLEKIEKPKDFHFSIYEPDPGWIYMFIPEFDKEQTSWAGPVLNKYQFGSLGLEKR